MPFPVFSPVTVTDNKVSFDPRYRLDQHKNKDVGLKVFHYIHPHLSFYFRCRKHISALAPHVSTVSRVLLGQVLVSYLNNRYLSQGFRYTQLIMAPTRQNKSRLLLPIGLTLRVRLFTASCWALLMTLSSDGRWWPTLHVKLPHVIHCGVLLLLRCVCVWGRELGPVYINPVYITSQLSL